MDGQSRFLHSWAGGRFQKPDLQLPWDLWLCANEISHCGRGNSSIFVPGISPLIIDLYFMSPRLFIQMWPCFHTEISNLKRFEQIELQAKLLNYFLGSNKSNINQCLLDPLHTIKFIPENDMLFLCWNSQSFHLHTGGVHVLIHKTFLEQVHCARSSCTTSMPGSTACVSLYCASIVRALVLFVLGAVVQSQWTAWWSKLTNKI